METVSIALLCTVIGCVIGVGTFSKARDKFQGRSRKMGGDVTQLIL